MYYNCNAREQTWGTRPSTPETKRMLLTLFAWEYGPKAAGAFSVSTASLIPIPTINQTQQTLNHRYTHSSIHGQN